MVIFTKIFFKVKTRKSDVRNTGIHLVLQNTLVCSFVLLWNHGTVFALHI